MSEKKSNPDQFVDKLASLYMRMREEKGDDATTSTVYDSVRRALGKLGIKLSQEAMEARTKRIAAAAIKQAKEELRKQYLIDIDVKAGKSSYALSFFSDVKIPNTPENTERWGAFMSTLAAKTRIGPDPRTGSVGILFRDGVWLGDLVLATDVTSFHIIEDVHTVNGDLAAPNARVVNNRFTHALTVKGDLHCNRDLLRQDPPPITVEGGITLLGERTVTEAVTPAMLTRWGMDDGDRLTLRNEAYVLKITRHGAFMEYMLEGENVSTCFEWLTDKWHAFKRTRFDPALLEEVNAKLARICLSLGLGQSFISPGEKKIESNIDRIATYLDYSLLGREEAGRDDTDMPQEFAVRTVIGYLDELWTMLRTNPDASSVQAHLSRDLDADLETITGYTCKPRARMAYKDADKDMALLTRLEEEPVDVNDLLVNGVASARFLMDTFKSDDSRSRLLHVLKDLDAAHAELTGTDPIASSGGTSGLGPLLADPDAVMAELRKKDGKAEALAVMERELRTLRKSTPKELIRKIVNVPISSEEVEFQKDSTLLRDLFAMHDSSMDGLGFDAERAMDLLRPAFSSVFTRRIDAVRRVWKGGKPDSPRVKDMAAELAGMDTGELIQALRKALRDVQAVIKKYNALTSVTQTCSPEEAEEEYEAKKTAFVLPAHLAFNFQGKLNRLCLTMGLGKQFLEQHSGALEENIRKIDGLLELCLGQPGTPGCCDLEGNDRQLLDDLRQVLAIIQRAVTGQADLGEAELEAERISDFALKRLEEIIKRPRPRVDITGMQADARILKALLDPNLTVDTIFNSSPRLLLYLNSALESKDMKIAVSRHIKPVYFALNKLQELKPEFKRYTLNDFLRSPDRAAVILEEVNENRDEPQPRQEGRKITDALRTLGTKSVRDTLKMLRNPQKKGVSEALDNDLDLMDSLLSFERGALGSLKLDAKRTGLLLLLSLESFIVTDLKARFESGAISSKNSRQIIQTLHDKLQWHLQITKAYNKLAPEPPKAKK